MSKSAKSGRKPLPPGLKVGFETTPPPVVKMPGLPRAIPPADAKLELLPAHETSPRARGGRGVASRSIKRSSTSPGRVSSAHAAKPGRKSGAHPSAGRSASGAHPAASGRKSTAKHKAVASGRLDDSARRRRPAGAAGGASIGVIGALVAVPIIAAFLIGMMILVSKNTGQAAGTTAPAATPAPAVAKPAPAASKAAEPATSAPTEEAAPAPAERPAREADAVDGEDLSPEDAKLMRERERELMEAERKMIEEREAKANAGGAAATGE